MLLITETLLLWQDDEDFPPGQQQEEGFPPVHGCTEVVIVLKVGTRLGFFTGETNGRADKAP